MKNPKLNDEVLDLMRERSKLVARLNEVEHLLATKRRLLIAFRETETAAHDVRRCTERRSSCGL